MSAMQAALVVAQGYPRYKQKVTREAKHLQINGLLFVDGVGHRNAKGHPLRNNHRVKSSLDITPGNGAMTSTQRAPPREALVTNRVSAGKLKWKRYTWTH